MEIIDEVAEANAKESYKRCFDYARHDKYKLIYHFNKINMTAKQNHLSVSSEVESEHGGLHVAAGETECTVVQTHYLTG